MMISGESGCSLMAWQSLEASSKVGKVKIIPPNVGKEGPISTWSVLKLETTDI